MDTPSTDPRERPAGSAAPRTAMRNLVRALRAKGVSVVGLDARTRSLTARNGSAKQVVVMRDGMWCMVWEPFRTDDAPDVEPLLPVGQEWVMAERLRNVLGARPPRRS
ncbi:hypothetical protein [Actinorugispora endophytica]|uniref:Uncharacterized protein n=1 Tax=Actinorugispora endophytica TaxID=1605990 RepID=A0A4R6UC24_9ACTN|nr:hypothetical protein [Actinorugispora endophytica]TDQ44181.1 hypothetical protein EV190_13718 [Actinorugispora endophytica]